MIETKRVVRILTDLEGVNEDLLNLFVDIQQNIDPRDAASRAEGLALLAQYNERLDAFDKASSDLRVLIERITHVDMRPYIVSAPEKQSDVLTRLRPHAPDEDFTFYHPIGFTFSGQTFLVSRWNRLYATVLHQLADRFPERFKALPDSPPFNGDQYNRKFSRSLANHPRAPLELPYGIYCKGSMAVKDIFINIRRLLSYFSLPESELAIYLSEDRDGAEE